MTSTYPTSTLIEETAHTELFQAPLQLRPIRHEATAEWNLATRIAFRFIFIYFALYGLPLAISVLPGLSRLVVAYNSLLQTIVPWMASHVLHLSYPITVFPNGSGDTTYNYVEILFFAAVATLATIVWSILDRKRSNYARLHQWLRLWVRFALGASLLSYGAMKVMLDQMSASPALSVLTETYGESSPMRLLWTMIGASPAYQIFCGTSEMIGGILLFLPFVTTLGALVSIGVMTNVFMLNMCYDVPVKIFSFHLLLMAIFLVAPNLQNLAKIFILRRTVRLSDDSRLFQRTWLNRGMLALQMLLGLYLASSMLQFFHREAKEFSAKPPHYGVWTVEEYSVDGNPRPTLLTDKTRWRRIIFQRPGSMGLQFMDDRRQGYKLQLDDAKKTMSLTKFDDPGPKAELSYREDGKDLMLLEGQFEGHAVRATLHRFDESKFLLTSRGFHWINEYPNNR